MTGSYGRHSRHDADALFGAVTDLSALPEWNGALTRVVDRPAELIPGTSWTVEMRALGRSWNSRSELIECDTVTRRFVHRSCTDDGNPSWALWIWTVDPAGTGSRIDISWELHPRTFWRRVLFVRVRGWLLRHREVPASLQALDAYVDSRAARHAVRLP
jgi:hypothetical protein